MSQVSSSKVEPPTQVELNAFELDLVHWEEFALAMEEHYHALELFQRHPNGVPMGHR